MPCIEPPSREYYKGLLVSYLTASKDKPSIVMAKDIGIPGKEFRWMFLLNRLGFNIAYAPYRGTWLSEGRFMPNSEGALSITEDISDLIRFSLEKFGSENVYIMAYSFGGSPSLVASTKFDEVSKIVIYAVPIYTQNAKLNGKYKEKGDFMHQLGIAHSKMTEEGIFNAYNGFNLQTWNAMIRGRTKLNPYRYSPQLSRIEILAIHGTQDKGVNYKRTADFIKALNYYCRLNNITPKTQIILPEKGHRNGLGPEEELKIMEFFAGKLDLKSVEEIRKFMDAHKKSFQRPEGKSKGEIVEVPFYDLVVKQIIEFQKAGLIKSRPLEEILSSIF